MLTWREIVANCEKLRNVRAHVCETTWTSLCVAANRLGVLPHDLREVTPALETGHVWCCLAKVLVQHHLVIVELAGDDASDVIGRDASGDVLTVPSTTGFAGRLSAMQRVDKL